MAKQKITLENVTLSAICPTHKKQTRFRYVQDQERQIETDLVGASVLLFECQYPHCQSQLPYYYIIKYNEKNGRNRR